MLKNIGNHHHPSRISIDYQEEKSVQSHDTRRITVSLEKNPREDISHGRKEIPVCTVPYSTPSFLSANISAMISSPQPQHHHP